MKKLFCVLLAVTMLLCMAACDKPETDGGESESPKTTVTVYVPEKITVTAGNEAVEMQIILEEGWQTKDSFKAQYRMADSASSIGYDMVCGEGITSQDNGAQKIVTRYDASGNAISNTVHFPEGSSVTKNEICNTYDERGRVVKQETKLYYANQENPVTSIAQYTYADTENGSKGTASDGGIVQELYYDAANRLVRQVTTTNGNEATRAEYTYDENGNMTKQETYVAGTLTTVNETIYKAYEVDAEKAAKLPYFKQGK